ncbi:Hypothetical predicted protein [Lecanosticta acicola]|uniref:Uncharacterized protein n=1 Tax=Lecanosticta acicola TaxID=111012 RepID=A0AAI8Z8U4_9PEZI|nr:Hypothetical predicted protein [Lecanosticta acicola]
MFGVAGAPATREQYLDDWEEDLYERSEDLYKREQKVTGREMALAFAKEQVEDLEMQILRERMARLDAEVRGIRLKQELLECAQPSDSFIGFETSPGGVQEGQQEQGD